MKLFRQTSYAEHRRTVRDKIIALPLAAADRAYALSAIDDTQIGKTFHAACNWLLAEAEKAAQIHPNGA